MDYEDKNKNALERVKELLDSAKNQGHIIVRVEDIENTFPELKESKSEKIREAIHIYLDWLDGRKDYQPKGDYTIKDMIDWVVKQGELASADKEESKFHYGDWITHNTANFVFKIINVGSNGYEVVNRENYKKTISFDNEGNYRLWTIQDAKDGDIVYYECHGIKHLFIVKSVGETKDHVEGHFWYDITRNECEIWDGGLPYSNIASMCDAIPATKEQRDLLFQKMKEAGYKWDSENKELKKIEQKALDPYKVVEWLKHYNLSDWDIRTSIIPDSSPTSIPHRVKWLSDEFINNFKKNFKI